MGPSFAELTGEGVFHVGLDGPEIFDRVTVTGGGQVDLNDARLEIEVGTNPGFGTQFTIVDLIEPDASVGNSRFHSLPEGATLTAGGFVFTLTYAGGPDGNDVVLQRPNPSTHVEIDDEILTVTDTSSAENNRLTVWLADSNLFIQDIGSSTGAASTGLAEISSDTVRVPLSHFDSIEIDTGGGDDTLTVDLAGGGLSPLIFRGGGNSVSGEGDALVLVDSSEGNYDLITFDYIDDSSGSIDVNGHHTIRYEQLEPIDSLVSADDVVLNYSAAAETITVSAAGTETRVDSTSGEVTTFPNPGRSLTINAGGGDDIVDVDGLGSGGGGFRASLSIDGQAGSDVINMNAALDLGSATAASDLLLRATDIRIDSVITSAASGAVDIQATRQIDLTAGAGIFTERGDIRLAANADGSTTGDFRGVEIAGATVSTVEGRVAITGFAGGSGPSNVGVHIAAGAIVETTGFSATSQIAITGTGAAGGSPDSELHHGVVITGADSRVSSAAGDILITGYGRRLREQREYRYHARRRSKSRIHGSRRGDGSHHTDWQGRRHRQPQFRCSDRRLVIPHLGNQNCFGRRRDSRRRHCWRSG